jgi:hypothetical protein
MYRAETFWALYIVRAQLLQYIRTYGMNIQRVAAQLSEYSHARTYGQRCRMRLVCTSTEINRGRSHVIRLLIAGSNID